VILYFVDLTFPVSFQSTLSIKCNLEPTHVPSTPEAENCAKKQTRIALPGTRNTHGHADPGLKYSFRMLSHQCPIIIGDNGLHLLFNQDNTCWSRASFIGFIWHNQWPVLQTSAHRARNSGKVSPWTAEIFHAIHPTYPLFLSLRFIWRSNAYFQNRSEWFISDWSKLIIQCFFKIDNECLKHVVRSQRPFDLRWKNHRKKKLRAS
jgi:hypothetical protein